MASVLSIFACRRSHSAALQITSSVYASAHPCPGSEARRNDAGTYRNPSPRPPPAIISGRGRRSNAGVTAKRRHPAAARCAHDSLCLPRFCMSRLRMDRRHRRCLQHSVGVNRPGAFRPGSDHASILPIVCCCRESSHRTRVPGTVAAGGVPQGVFQRSGLWPGWLRRRTENGSIHHQSPTSSPAHPSISRYVRSSPLRVYRSLRCAPFGLT